MGSYHPPTEKSNPFTPSVENSESRDDHGESALSSSQNSPSLPPKPLGEPVGLVSRQLSSNRQPPPVGPTLLVRPARQKGVITKKFNHDNCQHHQSPQSSPLRVRSSSASHSSVHRTESDVYDKHHRLSLSPRSSPLLSQPVLLSSEQSSTSFSPDCDSHSHEYEEMDATMPPLAAKQNEERNSVKFEEVGKRMTLKEFSSHNEMELPCLLKVCSGYTSLCERYSFGIDQLFVVIEIKTIDVVKMSEARSKENTGVHEIPLQTDRFTVVPILHSEWKYDLMRGGRIEVHQLLECVYLPKIVRVVFNFVTKERRTYIQAGSFLFPQEVKKKTKELQKRVLVAKMEDGSSIRVRADCTAKFDIGNTASFRLSLSQAVKLISLPFQCTLQSHEDDIYFTHTTVQCVDKSLFLFGVAKVKQGSIQNEIDSFKELSEIPANLGISVVPMAPKHEEILEDIYESAQSYYNIRQSHPSNMILKQQIPGGIDSPGGSHKIDPMSRRCETLVNSNPNSFPVSNDQTDTRLPSKIHYHSTETPANRKKVLQGRVLPDLPLSIVLAGNHQHQHLL